MARPPLLERLRQIPAWTWACAVAAAGLGIYLPWLGSFPLWDPWEPHYAQVAWEMGEYDTWHNPFYRGRDNWWSKPILMLWLLRASFAALWDPVANFAHHEWAARLPFALCAVGGAVLHFDWARRLFGVGVGLLSALILLTAPQYVLIGRQVMADMPFVATYAASMGYLAVALFAAPNQRTKRWAQALFWLLQGASVLAKGFVPPALAVLVLAGYAVATFRWRDYAAPARGRGWWRYAAVRGAAAVACSLATIAVAVWVRGSNDNETTLYRALVLLAGAALVGLCGHDLPIGQHARHVLRRTGATWGVPLFLLVCAPWFVFMSLEHGFPFWNEFVFYHHLGRAAGTIDKPGHPIDYFVRQLGFALYPWSAFLPVMLWRVPGRLLPFESVATRRTLFVFLTALLPFLFFGLSGTKFAHYIFPVVPPLAVLLAVCLWELAGGTPRASMLSEPLPLLGPVVPSESAPPSPLAPAHLFAACLLGLVTLGLLGNDLVWDYRHLLRLFVYYHDRPTPPDYQPYIALQIILFPAGALMGLGLFTARVRRAVVGALAVTGLVLACYVGWVLMPAMGNTYSFEPFYHAYVQMAEPGAAIGQYNTWNQPVRSVIFLFQNRAEHLDSEGKVKTFLSQPGRRFVLVDQRDLAKLRRMAREVHETLYVVFDGHPYGRLVSTEPNPEDARRARESILAQLPADARPLSANFGDQIRLVGFRAPEVVRRGEAVTMTFFYRPERLMDDDWQVFVHGDGARGGAHRLHGDHYPVQGLYPTTEWDMGEVVADTFTLFVPPSYPFDYFTVWVGWYNHGGRLEVVGAAPTDGDNRVRGPRLRVE